MALFGLKTKSTKTARGAEKAAEIVAELSTNVGGDAHVLSNPRITEKATMVTAQSVYVFDITAHANKRQVKAAIEKVYKVKPHKVAIVNIKPKTTRNMRTGQYGTKKGGKKAYVYLKKGETITIA